MSTFVGLVSFKGFSSKKIWKPLLGCSGGGLVIVPTMRGYDTWCRGFLGILIGFAKPTEHASA